VFLFPWPEDHLAIDGKPRGQVGASVPAFCTEPTAKIAGILTGKVQGHEPTQLLRDLCSGSAAERLEKQHLNHENYGKRRGISLINDC